MCHRTLLSMIEKQDRKIALLKILFKDRHLSKSANLFQRFHEISSALA